MTSRVGALMLESLMTRLEKIYEKKIKYCDYTVNLEDNDKTVSFREYYFRLDGKIITLKSRLIRSSQPWIASIDFEIKPRIPSKSKPLFYDIVDGRSYSTLFATDGSDFMFGPFFNRYSTLGTRLKEYMDTIDDHGFVVRDVVDNFVCILEEEGGIPTLLQIWDDLYESEITHEMLMEDPYCLDWN